MQQLLEPSVLHLPAWGDVLATAVLTAILWGFIRGRTAPTTTATTPPLPSPATCGKPGCLRCTAAGSACPPPGGAPLQQPTLHLRAGLRAQPMWLHRDLPAGGGCPLQGHAFAEWVRSLEASVGAIAEEALACTSGWAANPMVDDGSWHTLFLQNQGVLQERVTKQLPHTWALISAAHCCPTGTHPTPSHGGSGDTAPNRGGECDCVSPPMLGCSLGSVFISRLQFGASGLCVSPHCGVTNARLRLQLPLMQPPGGVALTVGGRSWESRPGECLVFDDSFMHSVAYSPDRAEAGGVVAPGSHARGNVPQPRLTLVVDLWHPEITAEGRREIVQQFPAAR